MATHLWITLVFPTPASPTTRILITGDVSVAADMSVSLVDVGKRISFAKKLSRVLVLYRYQIPGTRYFYVPGVRKAGPAEIDCGGPLTRVVHAI